MSCIVMDENRIASLAHKIITIHKGSLLVGGLGVKFDEERLADAMLAMNLDAFRQRYGMRALLVEDLDCIDLDRRNWKPLDSLSDVQFFKSLKFFLYQCSEGDVDEKPLYRTLNSIKAMLAPFIKEGSAEYEAAAWG